MTEKKNISSKITLISSCVGIALCLIAVFYGMKQGIFTSVEAFQTYMSGFGIYAPIIFVLIQIIQVVIPIVPGGISCLAGVMAFGGLWGFVYNYLGICIGSILVFLIAKRLGYKKVEAMIGGSKFEKYFGWTKNIKTFSYLFAAAIFFPVAPDDLLCYIAGLTKMNFSKFTLIILLGKPMSIFLYSLGLEQALHFLIK